MGMNRKWNMKIFEYHDLNGESSTPSSSHNEIEPMTPVDEVHTDASTRAVTMMKAPFDFSGNKADPNILSIDLTNATPDADFLSQITNRENWKTQERISGDVLITSQDDDVIIKFTSVIRAVCDFAENEKRWLLQFDYLTHPSLYRSFVLFDGVSGSDQDTKYQYGIDVPRTGYPRLEVTAQDEAEIVEGTQADEQYFTGQDYMSVSIMRWDDVYTLLYDDRYLLTVPTDNDSVNRVGVWAWSGSSTTIKNPKLYIIDDDTESDNVMIEGLLHTQDSTTPQDPEPTPKDPEPTPKDTS